ncbi:MAG: glycosyltransferase family 4 protein, partial [Microcystaceae cyanobacterium]
QGKFLPIIGDRLQRLAGRKVPEEIQALTYTFPISNLKWLLARNLLATTNKEKQYQFACLNSIELGDRMVDLGFGRATHLYSMLGEFAPLLIAADQQGLKIISDIYILLSTEKIMQEERKNFPDWETDSTDYQKIRKKLFTEDALLTRTHFFICPSEAVQQDLIANFAVSPAKTFVVPYAVNSTWLKLKPKPIPRRILFVGTADLRKGIHYLAIAAEQLYRAGYRYEFRIAGGVQSEVLAKPICKYLTFLGRIPRDQIQQEFINADVFVLPTLAEGSATVTYEALAAGLPVITTESAGSVVRNGIEGLIVAERDSTALAQAISEIVEDRFQRAKMAIAARKRAEEYTWENHKKRLIQALNLSD